MNAFWIRQKESEETEVKNIEWAKKQMKEIIDGRMTENEMFDRGYKNGITNSLDILNHLDEPKTVENTIHLLESILKENKRLGELLEEKHEEWLELMDEINNRETETLTPEWIDENKSLINGRSTNPDGTEGECYDAHYIHVLELQNLLVPKQEEVDRAYKDGYEEGKQHGFYKGYREGLADKGGEPETVADVIADFFKSLERLKEVMSMEVEELEE